MGGWRIRQMKFVDRWITPGTVLEVPDVYLVYGLFALVALVDVLNFLAACGSTVCRNILRKKAMIRRGFQHMLFSNVSAWKPKQTAPDPGEIEWWDSNPAAPEKRTSIDTRRIIFVRHGESNWNKIFN